ncbi:hypothetical protein OEZ85_004316 [Tetradesmus obliquus]|uniref:Uncharacterized protein n=1 Tax=Tetradesmus obliquus TaxID=3088 RepID=A0ABY8UKB8_TETOB|nr:hypothetical protein OEZ85_004316 [Tetradesmus obliquus]
MSGTAAPQAAAAAAAAAAASDAAPPALCIHLSSSARGLELPGASWQVWLPQVALRQGAVAKLALRFALQQQQQQQQQQGGVLLPAEGPLVARAAWGADGIVRLRSQVLLPVLQQLAGSSITAMAAAAADGTGSHTITFTLLPLFEGEMITTVGVLSLMSREDYADLKVPKGAALALMAACSRLAGQQ